MVLCKICLEEGPCGIVPAFSCVRASLEYINLNQRIVGRTLEYVENQRHLEKCQLVKSARTQDERGLLHLSKLQEQRRRLRTIVDNLLDKRLQILSSTIGDPGDTGNPFACPSLMLLHTETTTETPDIVKASLAAMDERWNIQYGGFTNANDDDALYSASPAVHGFEEVNKVAHLSNLYVALKWYAMIPPSPHSQGLMTLDI